MRVAESLMEMLKIAKISSQLVAIDLSKHRFILDG
jgi:hypothetical protein